MRWRKVLLSARASKRSWSMASCPRAALRRGRLAAGEQWEQGERAVQSGGQQRRPVGLVAGKHSQGRPEAAVFAKRVEGCCQVWWKLDFLNHRRGDVGALLGR